MEYLDEFDFNVGVFNIKLEKTAQWYYCEKCHNEMIVYQPITLCQNCNPHVQIPKWSELKN